MKIKTSFIFLSLVIFLVLFNFSLNTKMAKKDDDESEDESKSDDEPVFSLESGFYNAKEVSELTITSKGTIYYSLDSSDPTTSETASIYTKPISMYDRSVEENVYSKYQHEENSPYSTTLKDPFKVLKYPFDKITIVRAVSKSDDGKFSNVITKTYFIMDSDKLDYYSGIPVVSLVTDPANLFDKDKGIYVCGQQYLDWKKSPEYDARKNEYDTDNVANFFGKGKEWEREAEITYFVKGKLEFSQTMGIRVKGASTRNHKNKSFNIYCREKYGKSKLKYKLMEDNVCVVDGKPIEKYDSFSIRAFEWIERLRESIVQYGLRATPELATYDSKKTMFFIDGEFWGFYELTERSSAYYIQSNYDIPSKTVSLIKNDEVEEGPDSDLDELHKLSDFCLKNDLSDFENYAHVTEKIDIDSIILSYSQGVYLVNIDWPNKNYLMWRNNGEKIEGNPYSDGKWRFGNFDFDWSAGLAFWNLGDKPYATDNFNRIEEGKKEFPTTIFKALLKNSDFKERFAEIYCSFPTKVFEHSKMSDFIDFQIKYYMKYMTLGSFRWKNDDGKKQTYEEYEEDQEEYLTKELNKIKDFFNHRGEYAIDQMKKYLGLDNFSCP